MLIGFQEGDPMALAGQQRMARGAEPRFGAGLDRSEQFGQARRRCGRRGPVRPGSRRALKVGLGSDPQRLGGLEIGAQRKIVALGKPQHEIGVVGALQRAPNPLGFDGVAAVADAGGVDEHDRIAAEVEGDLDRIPRRAGSGRHDRRILAGQRVHQRRLSGIGRAGEHDGEPLAEFGDADAAVERRADALARFVDAGLELAVGEIVGVFDVGEIEQSVDGGGGLQEAFPDRVGLAAQRAAGDPHRLAALRRSLGVDEVGETLDLGQIELAVLEGAEREFAGLGGAEAF